jgi:hypothetical protein
LLRLLIIPGRDHRISHTEAQELIAQHFLAVNTVLIIGVVSLIGCGHISGIITACPSLQENLQTIAGQIASEHECSFCGLVRLERPVASCGEDDDDGSTVTVTLLSKDTLPERQRVLLRFAGTTVAGSVCTGEGCKATSTDSVTNTNTAEQQGSQDTLIISVVVAVLLLVFAILLVLLLTFFIRRLHYW